MSRQGLPQTRITAHSTSLVCQDVDIRGDVTVGAGTIIHPKATIIAAAGPIVIGENCVIEETAAIINRRRDILRIGDNNIFMVGCRVEADSIGDGNAFHPRSKVANGIVVTDHCVFGAGTATLTSVGADAPNPEKQSPYTTVHGELSEQRRWDGSGQETEENLYKSHAEYLREILPKFNRMRVV